MENKIDLKIIKKIIESLNSKEINYSFQKNISYSQYSSYLSCQHKWKLNYVDKLKIYKPSMEGVFGTTIHETLQEFVKIMFEKSGVEADRFDILKYFENSFKENYKKELERNKNIHFSSPSEMNEYFIDGVEIVKFYSKNRNKYFSTRNEELLGIEVPLYSPIQPLKYKEKLIFNGYIDLLTYNKNSDTIKITDYKTSRSGWRKEDKVDPIKTSQLLLYKQIISELFRIPLDKIEVEFVILRRKCFEIPGMDMTVPRISSFSPPSKTKLKQVNESFNNFINEVFDNNSNFILKEKYFKNVTSKCSWCPFNKTEYCDKKN